MSETKYDVLLETCVNSYNERRSYKIECREFIRKIIIEGLAEYLGRPQCIDLFNLKDGFDMRKSPGWTKSMSLEKDTFWHFGVVLSLESSSIRTAILLHLSLKKENSSYSLKMMYWNSPEKEIQFKINADNTEDLNNFYDSFFDKIKDDIEYEFKNFLNKKQRLIGFNAFADENIDE